MTVSLAARRAASAAACSRQTLCHDVCIPAARSGNESRRAFMCAPSPALSSLQINRRSFASSGTRSAVTEASSPSLKQAPSVSTNNSPLLRNNAKAATQTPGIQWTDGEVGLERQVRKMNMYTVRGRRSFSSSCRSAARVFTPRKTFLYDQYSRLLRENKVVLLLQHNSLTVKEAAKIRREIEQVELSSASQSTSSSKAKLTIVRTGLLKPLFRRSSSLRELEPILNGPIALLTFDHLSPSYLGKVLAVLDKALGAGKAQPKPVLGSNGHTKEAKNVNTRLLPLAAIVEGSASSIRLVDIARLRDISLLPSLKELHGQLVALLSHSPSQLVSTLNQAKGVSLLQTLDAIRDAQSHALASDESTLVFGEDVAFGGVFRSTMGLSEEFGKERVFNTPLTEQGIVGFGIGVASLGHTAIAEIQFADYIFPAFDQLVNEAAKYRYRSGNQYNAGRLTIRSPCMGVGHGALYHSQSVEQFFMPAPGLKVVIPRSPIQAKGLLLASIRDENPVIFLEPKVLYRSSVEHVPVDDYTLPLSSAEVLQNGDTITLLSWGAPLYSCVEAISMLHDPPSSIATQVPHGIRNANVELIDLRTILPWDRKTVAKSVAKTGRCVIVHEAPVTAGAGAEIAAHLQQSCFLHLEAPICRIGGFDTPFPHVHETWYKPGSIQILDGLIRTLTY